MLVLSALPLFAAPASDIPANMLDNVFLDALTYTGYKTETQKADGSIFVTYGTKTPSSVLSGIGYGTGASGLETVSVNTKTGLAPNLESFKSGGLCCASYVSYVYYNYLPNIKISSDIADRVSLAADKALKAAEQTSAVLRAFGDGEATGGNTEADEALLDKVRRNETLKKISVILGRYREIIADKRKNSFSYGLGEKYDIVCGNDINNCLSSELALLSMPQTEILFFKRYYEKRLQQYRRREPSVKGDGDMIVLIDESSSTREIAPWTKAFALALMYIALHGNKKFALIHFANSFNVKADIFEKGKFTTDDILSAATHFFGGGTDFEAPLNKAMELIGDGFENADAVIITDGQCKVSEKFSEKFREEKLKNRVTVTGILLDKLSSCGDSLVPFCDKIYRTSKLSEDEIALDILGKKV